MTTTYRHDGRTQVLDPAKILTAREVRSRSDRSPRGDGAGVDAQLGLYQVIRGVWIEHDHWKQLPRWERAKAVHAAINRVFPDPPVFCGMSAALIWGLPLLAVPKKPHVIGGLPGSGSRRTSRRVTTHAWPVSEDEMCTVNGLRLTSLVRTTVDCARVLERRSALVVVDAALRSGAHRQDLERTLGRSTTKRGTRRAREILALSDARSESPGETLTRLLLIENNLTGFTPQYTVTLRGNSFRVDFAWEEEKLIVEFDGEVKYSGRFGDPTEMIRAERRREKELTNAGWRVLRVSWNMLTRDPEQVVAMLRQELAARHHITSHP